MIQATQRVMSQPCRVFVAILAGLWTAQTRAADIEPANPPVIITVAAEPQQAFDGFGANLNPTDSILALSADQRKTVARSLWTDLGFRFARVWLNSEDYAPKPGVHDCSAFVKYYITSHQLEYARQAGVTSVIVTPGGIPAYMATGGFLRDDQVNAYAELLADFVKDIRDKYQTVLDGITIQNEPMDKGINLHYEQWPRAIAALRAALDSRGLQSVEIFGPDAASADDTMERILDPIQGNSAAWKALSAISSHSYNMAATAKQARRISATHKGYWITEASANGPEEPGDALAGASTAARVLNDLNHSVTRWFWFLGYEIASAEVPGAAPDDQTRILRYYTHPFRVEPLQKYYYFLQLASTFQPGVVLRRSLSSTEGDMVYTYGKKPRLIGSAGVNADGTWAVGVVNYTDNSFAAGNEWNRTQGGYAPGQSIRVRLVIKELQNVSQLQFAVRASGKGVENQDRGTLTARNGIIELTVQPLELLTLRSGQPHRAPQP